MAVFCGVATDYSHLPRSDRGLISALVGDGRPLLSVTALALLFSGGFALFLTVTGQFLPHDVHYLQMNAADLCAVAECRINAFMFHDRTAFGGSLIAVAILYLWLIEFPLRDGERWAWWTIALTGATGFASFLAYLGYGYLDSWHGVGTLALIPVFLVGLVRSRELVVNRPPAQRVIPSFTIDRTLLLATAAGMILGGAAILFIGMTQVFVVDDLDFMRITVARLNELSPRLVPLIAHDRAGFGGGLLTTGLLVASCVWFSSMTRALRQALWLAGAAGFGCAIGVHAAVGYTAWRHLTPAIAGAAMFVLGMIASSFTRRRS